MKTVEATFKSAVGAERMEQPQSFVAREEAATKLAECMVAAKRKITKCVAAYLLVSRVDECVALPV